jgi:hypothetical protein
VRPFLVSAATHVAALKCSPRLTWCDCGGDAERLICAAVAPAAWLCGSRTRAEGVSRGMTWRVVPAYAGATAGASAVVGGR